MPNSTPLSAAQAAKQTGHPKRTILHAITTGKLPAQRMDNGYQGVYLIAQVDLDRWVAERADHAEANAMNAAPCFRSVCQFTGEIADPPEISDALKPLGASGRLAPDSTTAGASHTN